MRTEKAARVITARAALVFIFAASVLTERHVVEVHLHAARACRLKIERRVVNRALAEGVAVYREVQRSP